MDITDKRVLITGGASGIGWALAEHLLAAGCRVMICDFNEQALDETAKLNLPDLAVCFCDVSDRSQVERLAEDTWQALGGVDLLFANAGVGVPLSPLLQQEDDHARWVFEVNFFGAWNTIQVFAPRMLSQGTPCHFTVTGSENSICVPAPLLGAYNASKHAVLGLTETLDIETPEFFGVSILCPALVATNIAASLTRIPESYGGPVAVPAGAGGRGFTPEQVADSALAGVQAGDFYIFSHHCNTSMIESRMNQQLATIGRQTSADDGSDIIDTGPMLGGLFKQLSACNMDQAKADSDG